MVRSTIRRERRVRCSTRPTPANKADAGARAAAGDAVRAYAARTHENADRPAGVLEDIGAQCGDDVQVADVLDLVGVLAKRGRGAVARGSVR